MRKLIFIVVAVLGLGLVTPPEALAGHKHHRHHGHHSHHSRHHHGWYGSGFGGHHYRSHRHHRHYAPRYYYVPRSYAYYDVPVLSFGYSGHHHHHHHHH